MGSDFQTEVQIPLFWGVDNFKQCCQLPTRLIIKWGCNVWMNTLNMVVPRTSACESLLSLSTHYLSQICVFAVLKLMVLCTVLWHHAWPLGAVPETSHSWPLLATGGCSRTPVLNTGTGPESPYSSPLEPVPEMPITWGRWQPCVCPTIEVDGGVPLLG